MDRFATWILNEITDLEERENFKILSSDFLLLPSGTESDTEYQELPVATEFAART